MSSTLQVRARTALFIVVALGMLTPGVSGGVALLAGLFFALVIGNPCVSVTKPWTPRLLQLSVIGLGAAMNLTTVAATGLHGLLYTTVGITVTLGLGWLLGRWLKLGPAIMTLVSVGTAICGGSAIAAVAPVIQAEDHDVSVSLVTVFFLNAMALFIFPWIGHALALSERQFGLWAALAIHDTSSVVGAALQYGPKALEIATTVKLARALWIVPTTIVIGFLYSRGSASQTGRPKGKKPWFILGFIAMSAAVTEIAGLAPYGHVVAEAAKRSLVLTLFLIGSGLSAKALKTVGFRPMVLGVALWILAASATLFAVSAGWIV